MTRRQDTVSRTPVWKSCTRLKTFSFSFPQLSPIKVTSIQSINESFPSLRGSPESLYMSILGSENISRQRNVSFPFISRFLCPVFPHRNLVCRYLPGYKSFKTRFSGFSCSVNDGFHLSRDILPGSRYVCNNSKCQSFTVILVLSIDITWCNVKKILNFLGDEVLKC